jgi:hypothetical protein
MVSTGPEPSSVSSATSPGIELPNVTPKRPLYEVEEEDQDREEDDVSPPWTMGSQTMPLLPRNL